MGPIIWVAIAGGAVVLVGLVWFFWPRKGCNHDCQHPLYLQDRRDPLRHWVHGVMAVYRGNAGDPAYWDPACADRQASGWGLDEPDDLHELMQRYRDGETNIAFDKARLIWLARLGQGLGWLDEHQSWEWCRMAADSLRQTYPSWAAFAQEVQSGRADWYDGKVPPAELERAHEDYRFAAANILPPLTFR